MSEPVIEVRDLRKSYGEVHAVRGLDFEVSRGEVFGLLGPNGAGKTSTVEILEGLRPRTAGSVRVLGLDPGADTKALKDRIGVCLQQTNLPEKLRVSEALDWFGAFYSRTADAAKILERLQLTEKKNAAYGTLSGGQKQRVAIALALINDPEIVFFDEPTSGLDPQVRLEIHGLIQQLRDDQRSIILTTHYIEEAERLCDRVAIVDEGKIVAVGTPREILERTMGESRIEIRTEQPMPPDPPVNGLPHEFSAGRHAITLWSAKPARAIADLVKWVDAQSLGLEDIHLKRPTLEDAFIKLTGKSLRD
jgi:ABC-2 type transport system ATP-binding protein